MTGRLSSMRDAANVAIVGASGGIGLALTNLLINDSSIGRINALSRSPVHVESDKVHYVAIDITNEDTIERAAALVTAEDALDMVFVATGILHDKGELQPEKRMTELNPDTFARVIAINTLGPALVAKHFLPGLRRDGKTVFAALSARVGSISDNRLGGWASYRASKAALNMLLRTFSIEHARKNPESIIAALHPGTVATDLSAPFRSRVPAQKLFTPEQSADYLLGVIEGLTAEDTGGFFAWDGSAIQY